MGKKDVVDSKTASLAALHPWPSERPEAPPNDCPGWLSTSTRELLASVLSDDTRLVVELGSWLGLSTRFIADRAVNAAIVAVDHWRGSSEHRDDPRLRNLLPVLYESFLDNCWEHRARIIPLRMDTIAALDTIARHRLSPDIIYLDADHSYEAVRADLSQILTLFPQSILIGDDWDWATVRRAATEAAGRHRGRIGVHGCAWRFCDAETGARLGVRMSAM